MIDLEEYYKEIITLNLLKANLLGFVFFIFLFFLFGVPFYLIWNNKINLINEIDSFNLSYFLIIFILGSFFHEVIHAIFFRVFNKKGFKTIKIGFKFQTLTPYCHCSEPIKVWQYMIVALAPGLLMGIFPSFVSLFTGDFKLFIIGIIFTVSGIGDFMMINILKKENKNIYILDHPDEPGFYLFKKKGQGY